jgi:hypothetical protein
VFRERYEREGLLLAHYPWPGPDCIRRRREIVWAEIVRAGRVIEPAAKYGALVAAGIAIVLMLLHWRRHDSVRAVEILGPTTPFDTYFRLHSRRAWRCRRYLLIRAPPRRGAPALGVHRRRTRDPRRRVHQLAGGP